MPDDNCSEEPALFEATAWEPTEAEVTALENLRSQYEEIRARNKARVKELATHQKRLNDMMLIKVRLEALVQYMFGTATTVDLLHFELLFEAGVSDLLDQALTEARQATLMAPYPTPPHDPNTPTGGLFIPGT